MDIGGRRGGFHNVHHCLVQTLSVKNLSNPVISIFHTNYNNLFIFCPGFESDARVVNLSREERLSAMTTFDHLLVTCNLRIYLGAQCTGN